MDLTTDLTNEADMVIFSRGFLGKDELGGRVCELYHAFRLPPMCTIKWKLWKGPLSSNGDTRLIKQVHSGKLIQLAGKRTRIEDIFSIENGDIPASYASLPE